MGGMRSSQMNYSIFAMHWQLEGSHWFQFAHLTNKEQRLVGQLHIVKAFGGNLGKRVQKMVTPLDLVTGSCGITNPLCGLSAPTQIKYLRTSEKIGKYETVLKIISIHFEGYPMDTW